LEKQANGSVKHNFMFPDDYKQKLRAEGKIKPLNNAKQQTKRKPKF
jgi:hypothetical protein